MCVCAYVFFYSATFTTKTSHSTHHDRTKCGLKLAIKAATLSIKHPHICKNGSKRTTCDTKQPARAKGGWHRASRRTKKRGTSARKRIGDKNEEPFPNTSLKAFRFSFHDIELVVFVFILFHSLYCLGRFRFRFITFH